MGRAGVRRVAPGRASERAGRVRQRGRRVAATRGRTRPRPRDAYPERVQRDSDPPAAAPTFDQQLLQWLGDEPEDERAADAGRVRSIAQEFAAGFDALSGIGAAVTVFGSA